MYNLRVGPEFDRTPPAPVALHKTPTRPRIVKALNTFPFAVRDRQESSTKVLCVGFTDDRQVAVLCGLPELERSLVAVATLIGEHDQQAALVTRRLLQSDQPLALREASTNALNRTDRAPADQRVH
ncbi:hypothetical protein D2E42_23985 [Mycobacteroides abscessus]|nr:hypothetical protein DDK10_24030 [Mycobacteroides abscessus]RIR66530.1 hypothetical protein D2E42_23985 [Mycobacteroides abscessus]